MGFPTVRAPRGEGLQQHRGAEKHLPAGHPDRVALPVAGDVFISRVYKRDPELTLEQSVLWYREENDQPFEKVQEAYGWLADK